MSQQFHVDPGELRAHAVGLAGVAADVGTALSAAQSVALGSEAYGLLCAWMPGVINEVSADVVAGINQSLVALDLTVSELTAAAAAYQGSDAAMSAALRSAAGIA
ncbi:MAG: hypothetical protein IPJ15_14390 [Actinomycetales bacterium]|nr:hypothetical protein [Candidatus Phosphoribacter baldrii]MBK7612371.1 hypothetical protein [Candidatus Phosphoribacter baldrii]HRC12746.1 type VII secretion target [Dermatophilaceae bacterium]